MPRYSNVKPLNIRRDYIAARLVASEVVDTIPIWEGNLSVACKVISIPLDCLVLRVNNARTLDAQKYAASQSVTYPDGSGGRTNPANQETFLQQNESEQETQDHQFELLLHEAKKKTGRSGTRDLLQIILQDGWTSEDRPVITQEGVLINGNCRVTTIEHLLNNEQLDFNSHNIDPAAPRIEVKVVPTPADEWAIEELERKLQLGTAGRLEYNWVQATTDMRRILERTGGNYNQVLKFYNHLANYSSLNLIKHCLMARDLLDSSLSNLDMDGQQMNPKVPQFLFDMAAKQNKAASKKDWEQKDIKMLNGLTEIFLKISLANAAEREQRYNLQEIKKEQDISKFYTDFKANGIGLFKVEVRKHPITGDEIVTPKVDYDKVNALDQDQLKVLGTQAAITAQEIKDSNDLTDLVNKPRKKLEAILTNIRLYQSAVDDAEENNVTLDKNQLSRIIGEIISNLEKKKSEL